MDRGTILWQQRLSAARESCIYQLCRKRRVALRHRNLEEIRILGTSVESEGIKAQTGDSICAVVVTFCPEISELVRMLRALIPQVDGVVVVDNSTDAGATGRLEQIAKEFNIYIIAPGRNVGVAAGQNAGIARARSQGFTYVLLMDQDSMPNRDMVDRLRQAITCLQGCGARVSAVGPRFVDRRSGESYGALRISGVRIRKLKCEEDKVSQYDAADLLISSGCLISVRTLDDVGEMDTSFFVDRVDTEWFLRARAEGYRAYFVCDAVMEHQFGESFTRVWAGRWRGISHRGPTRHYYIFRNSVLLYKRRYTPRAWMLADMTRLVVLFFFYAIVGRPRIHHVSMMLRGVWHGLRGKTGPLVT